jgi:hypothetical protein
VTEPSLDRATTAIGELSGSVRALHTEVVQAEALRTEKIRAIQRVLFVLAPCVVLLIVLAASNAVLLARTSEAANASRSTNELLLGCLQPGTKCSNTNATKTAEVLDRVRQTQFVIAVCQRQNPVDKDPDGARMQACVRRYYPGFTLPPQR